MKNEVKVEEPTRRMSRGEVDEALAACRRSSARMRAAVAHMDDSLAAFLVAEVKS